MFVYGWIYVCMSLLKDFCIRFVNTLADALVVVAAAAIGLVYFDCCC